MDESRLELKVGALVLAAVLGAFTLLVLMGELARRAVSWTAEGSSAPTR